MFLVFVLMSFPFLVFFLSESSFNLSFGVSFLMSFMFLLSKYFFVVCLVSLVVLLWGFDYMSHDESFNSYYLFTCCFVFSMLGFIVSKNSFMILATYDLLGFTSFFLILHYCSFSSFSASYITLMMNKLGDLFLMMALSKNWVSGGVDVSFVLIPMIVKSALVPFSSWLPLAMKAPTPVSALVHSSTLVTAGVLLSSKSYFPTSSLFLLSTFSVLVASFCALSEMDLKKVVALSTMSQMGLLGVLSSMSTLSLFFLHLIIHAFLKSLLFVCVGSNMKESSGSQEGKSLSMTGSSTIYLLSSGIGLTGLFWTCGQHSKEVIVSFFINSVSWFFFLFLFSLSLTFFYCCKLMSPIFSKIKPQTYFSESLWVFWIFGLTSGFLFIQELSFSPDLSTKSVGISVVSLSILGIISMSLSFKMWKLFFLFSSTYLLPTSLVVSSNGSIFLSFQSLFSKFWLPSFSLSLTCSILFFFIFIS